MTHNEDLNIKINPVGIEGSTVISDQMPLKILALADLTPGSPTVDMPISVNKNNFNDIMSMLCPRLRFSVPGRMGQTQKEIVIELTFDSINSFVPEEIVPRVSGLTGLMKIRKLLAALANQELSCQEFQEHIKGMKVELPLFSQLQSAPTSPALIAASNIEGTEPLNSLFEMVDISPSQKGKSTSAIDNLIAQILQPQTDTDKQTIEAAIGEIDDMLGDQLNEILHHKEFQSLEAAWRGLKFLIDKTDFHKKIRIEILNVPKNELRDTLYTHVFKPEHDRLTTSPLSVMIADYQFERLPHEIELLRDISKMAQSIQVPFITTAAPGFFGLKSFARLSVIPSLNERFKGPEYVKWNSFRQSEQSSWVMLMVNRFLARLPYGQNTCPIKGFSFEENISESQKYLWANPIWAMGSILAADFANTGWCIDICGKKTETVLTPLPTYEYQINPTQKTIISLEGFIPEQKQAEFERLGFSLMACQADSISSYVYSVPTAHLPERYENPADTMEAIVHAALPYQLFAGRLSHYLSNINSELCSELSRESLEKTLRDKILSFISLPSQVSSEDSVVVQIEENPDGYDAALRVRPAFKILGLNADIVLGWGIPR
ncbi:type VI secretion system contractile sheath large subunit [bacterium]|nr:type VI secretion system contractile sheath large subunit [bacterium]MBU1752860.1 type VI secretion system contractile sheath large subunit [bacterium]